MKLKYINTRTMKEWSSDEWQVFERNGYIGTDYKDSGYVYRSSDSDFLGEKLYVFLTEYFECDIHQVVKESNYDDDYCLQGIFIIRDDRIEEFLSYDYVKGFYDCWLKEQERVRRLLHIRTMGEM